MKKNFTALICFFLILLNVTACSPVDKDYGVVSEVASTVSDSDTASFVEETRIMSSDRVMSKYFDISLFDEENYANIYLGKKFKIDAEFNGQNLTVPTKIEDLKTSGWVLAEGNTYNENSLVFAYETIEVTFINQDGVKLKANLYNSSRSSVLLSECYVVKFTIENNFYNDSQNYNKFNINGITNSMALTDIILTLGTPSHFYRVSDDCYYLDYFISKKDRRNGITIYVNPIEDLILSIEFSYYK